MSTKPETVRFSYIKNNQFRVVHVDGAIGSLTPRGLIHCAVYSERPALPDALVYAVADDKLGEVRSTESREGIVREIDVDLIMTVQSAVDLRNWLNDRIDEAGKLFAEGDPND